MKGKTIALTCLCLLSSCSVYKAACKDGADIQEVQASHSRNQFLSLGAKIVSSETLPTGELVETYQIPKARGSAARAVMHGLLDLSTFFVWEVAGTPIEYSLDKPEFIVVKVTYGPDDIAKKAELQ
jgi:hypothetical protein